MPVDAYKKVEKRLERKERRYEVQQLMKEKHSDDYEVLEEVFDKSTLMTIYDLMNRGVISEIHGVVKAGKEARIYWGVSPEGEDLAIKIYLTVSAEFRKGMLPYIMGDPRFQNIKRSGRSLIFAWARKEFKNLVLASEAGVRVPKPIAVSNNVLVMEFIGEKGVSAPTLREVELSRPASTYRKLISYVNKLYNGAKLVHGDLSEYNIMIWRNEPVIFDVSQAVPLEHPNAIHYLIRDLQNLNRYFTRLGVKVTPVEKLLRRIVGEYV
ncbi:serine protein kinase RIO [Candidatus Bathyarchaeota archaeon]|nr:MAG: serine protein kinase RIO [Candidatus Bathyarchaeota archaeon]